MGALAIAVPYVIFVWWFSTGSVLLLVGLYSSRGGVLKAGAAALFVASLTGVAASSYHANAAGAYCVFTCAVLLWGAIEISLLAGWITGPRPDFCPRDCARSERVWYALQAIAYHELALIGTAGLVYAVTVGAPNQLGWWTFAALLVLRQSAKINLFLGVRMPNDELLPPQVGFLRSYFSRKPINPLFPLSVALATAASTCLAVAAVNSVSAFQALAFALLAALVTLGTLEHWFMVLPLPVVDLWRWSIRASPAAPLALPAAARPMLSVISNDAPIAPERAASPRNAAAAARQRLEEQFRQAYRERQRSANVNSERPSAPHDTATNRTSDKRAP